MNLGEAFKLKRKEQGLTQQQVADELGYSVSSIRNMERHNGNVLVSRYLRYGNLVGINIFLEWND